VITVVVRIDEEIDLARRALLGAIEEHLGGVGELTVNDDERFRRHQPADGAAARGKGADVEAQCLELGRHRRRRRL